MASNWASFRKVWLKPEVYPLIGSMVVAVGVCTTALVNKARDPSVTWNKSKRSEGIEAQLDGVDEIVPLWSSAKSSSIRIFGGGNPIMDNKIEHRSTSLSVTVPVEGGDEEEKEEEQVVEEVSEEHPVLEAVTELVDETAETINAAVDAAIESAAAIPETGKVVPAVTEAVAHIEDATKPSAADKSADA